MRGHEKRRLSRALNRKKGRRSTGVDTDGAADALKVDTPYHDEKDVAFYADPELSSSFLVLPGQFAIFFPADGHKPGVMAGARDAVRKVVVKVRVPG